MSTRRKRDRERHGHLFIIGGAEDREEDKEVLGRLVELTEGSPQGIAIITTASSVPDEVWATYDRAFADLGVKKRHEVSLASREEANDDAVARLIHECSTIFMTGGDQKRLLSIIGGTKIDRAMHLGLRTRGACIAGTSAGASAMSEHMLFEGGNREVLPTKGIVSIAAGLGFIRRVVIDQHFSERQRLGRLLAVVAQNPYLLGAGIDENTALIVEPGNGLEVVGEGAVTVVDGREMLSNFLEADDQERLELTNVKLHLMPAGVRYYFDANLETAHPRTRGGRPVPPLLYDVVAAVASSGDAETNLPPLDPGFPR